MRLREGGLTSRRLGDELVVLDLESSMYYAVAGSGAMLFDLLRDEHSEDDLVTAVRGEYAVDEATARSDVRTFVEKLSAAGLLVL